MNDQVINLNAISAIYCSGYKIKAVYDSYYQIWPVNGLTETPVSEDELKLAEYQRLDIQTDDSYLEDIIFEDLTPEVSAAIEEIWDIKISSDEDKLIYNDGGPTDFDDSLEWYLSAYEDILPPLGPADDPTPEFNAVVPGLAISCQFDNISQNTGRAVSAAIYSDCDVCRVTLTNTDQPDEILYQRIIHNPEYGMLIEIPLSASTKAFKALTFENVYNVTLSSGNPGQDNVLYIKDLGNSIRFNNDTAWNTDIYMSKSPDWQLPILDFSSCSAVVQIDEENIDKLPSNPSICVSPDISAQWQAHPVWSRYQMIQ